MFIIILRTAIMYFAVILAIRIMGKRQIGDLQPSELVITILISEIAAIPLQDNKQTITNGLAAIFTLVSIEVIMSFFSMKCLFFRKMFYGNSAILIKDGQVDQQMLNKLRVTVPDLMEVLRCSGVFELDDVEYALLETNGQLSVLLKQDRQNVTLRDMNLPIRQESLPCLVVSDGKLINDSLKICGLDKQEIQSELNKKNLKIKDVFVMTADKYKNFNIVKSVKKK